MKITEADVVWTPNTYTFHADAPDAGAVRVERHMSGWRRTRGDRWMPATSLGQMGEVKTKDNRDRQLLAMFILFNTLVVRDGIDPARAHHAFLAIDELPSGYLARCTRSRTMNTHQDHQVIRTHRLQAAQSCRENPDKPDTRTLQRMETSSLFLITRHSRARRRIRIIRMALPQDRVDLIPRRHQLGEPSPGRDLLLRLSDMDEPLRITPRPPPFYLTEGVARPVISGLPGCSARPYR